MKRLEQEGPKGDTDRNAPKTGVTLTMASKSYPTADPQLAGFLQESYQGSRDERPTPTSGLFTIQIDDRRSTDVSPDFCSLSVVVPGTAETKFTLYLSNPPLDAETRALIGDKDGKITGSRPELHMEIPLLIKDVGYLRKLAQAFRRIIGRGRIYSNRNWKWVCRRTADSIDRLADRLMEYRRLRRHTPERLSAYSPSADTRGSAGSGPDNNRFTPATLAGSAHADDQDIFRLLGAD